MLLTQKPSAGEGFQVLGFGQMFVMATLFLSPVTIIIARNLFLALKFYKIHPLFCLFQSLYAAEIPSFRTCNLIEHFSMESESASLPQASALLQKPIVIKSRAPGDLHNPLNRLR